MGFRRFAIFRIHKYGIHFVLYLYWIHYSFISFFSNFFCLIQTIYDLMDFFNKVSDVLPAFTCAGAIGNLWSIYLGVISWDKKGKRPHGQRL